MKENKKDISIEEATKVLIEQREKKIKECWSEIEKILKKYGFEIIINNSISLNEKNNG